MNLVLLAADGEAGKIFSEASYCLVFREFVISLNLESLTTTCGSAGMANEFRWEVV